jgi:hypothetical protein
MNPEKIHQESDMGPESGVRPAENPADQDEMDIDITYEDSEEALETDRAIADALAASGEKAAKIEAESAAAVNAQLTDVEAEQEFFARGDLMNEAGREEARANLKEQIAELSEAIAKEAIRSGLSRLFRRVDVEKMKRNLNNLEGALHAMNREDQGTGSSPEAAPEEFAELNEAEDEVSELRKELAAAERMPAWRRFIQGISLSDMKTQLDNAEGRMTAINLGLQRGYPDRQEALRQRAAELDQFGYRTGGESAERLDQDLNQ